MIQRIIAFIKSNIWAVLFLGFIVVTVVFTAINSSGYHHADEHYQIIEFANYILGNINSNQLTWEFSAQIRPSVQPIIAAGFFKIFNTAGINDPFVLTAMLRIATGFFGLWVYVTFIQSWWKREGLSKGIPVLMVMCAFFLWFMPYLLVRFSSENLSSLFFLWGLGHYFSNRENKQLVIVGLLLGLSFALRFQMGIAVAGFASWLLLIERIKTRAILSLLWGGVTGLVVLVFCDYLFYGEFVFSPWKYLASNLIDGKAASFGVDPWWIYFQKAWVNLTLPISVLVLIAIIGMFAKQPKHPVYWILIPFVLVHCLIGHKEFRFLFPVVFCIPWLVFSLLSVLSTFKRGKMIGVSFMVLLLSFNLVGAIAFSQFPSGAGRLKLANYIHNNYKKPVRLIHTDFSNPYQPWPGVEAHWYSQEAPISEFQIVHDLHKLNAIELKPNHSNLLIVRGFDFSYAGFGEEGIYFNKTLLETNYSGMEENLEFKS